MPPLAFSTSPTTGGGRALPARRGAGAGGLVGGAEGAGGGEGEGGGGEGGGEGFGGGAEVDDVVRVEALEGADGLAVVAELAVVVVLQDQSAGASGPVDGGGAAVVAEGDAHGELVGG